jgi:DNA-binding SARP family transcriptional activator/streptogramin lyase
MEFHILGPLEVTDEGESLPLGGTKQRALLALLLLRPNEPVSVDRIVDELWGEQPPPTASKNVQVYVSHLRKVLGETTIATTRAGYALHVADGCVDAHRAEEAFALAQGKPAAEQVELLRAALALWRGPPLGELADLPAAGAEMIRLEELRLRLLKRRIEAELELGRHEEVVPELEKLVAAHPLDERLRAQLMLALYQSGRQAEALAVYRNARRTLDEELGLEPDEELRALEQRILAHDPSLRPPAPASAPMTSSGARREGHGRPLPRFLLLGAAALAVSVLLAAVVGLTRDTTEPIVVPANSVAVVDADREVVVGAIPVGREPDAIVAGAGAVWVANVGEQTLSRIDPETLRVTKTVGLGFEPTDLATDDEHVWVAGGYDHALWRVDRDGIVRLKLSFVERLGPLPPGFERGPAGVAVGEGSVWLSHGDEVTEFDPATGAVRRTVRAGGRWHSEIAAADRQVWVGVNNSIGPGLNTGLDRVDLSHGRRVDRFGLLSDASEIVLANQIVLVAIRIADAVWELDPASGLVQRTIRAGDSPVGLVFLDDSLWVTAQVDGELRRIDVRSGETESVLPIGQRLGDVAAADGRLFVAVSRP